MVKPVALVTGSRTGLGRYLAEQLVHQGYQVVGCSRSAIDWRLDGYWHHTADVGDERQVSELVNWIRSQFGRLDVAINNAGVASMNAALLTPATTIDRLLAVNFRGTFLVSRESAKLMRRRRFGRIINLTSVAVPMLLEGEAVYSASKAAVEMLTRVSAREFGSLGITVNAVGPSPIETELIRGVPAEKIQGVVDRLAIRRLGQPRDVFNVVEWLIRPTTDYVTGQVIYLGGP